MEKIKFVNVIEALIVMFIGLAMFNFVLNAIGCKEPPTVPLPVVTTERYVGSWEKEDPKRSVWTDFLMHEIERAYLPAYDLAGDREKLCPNYIGLVPHQRAMVWTELFIGISKYESSWDPADRYFEDTMGYYSEGLLQLSYEDKEWMPDCKFIKGSKDNTILDPLLNLDCGMKIMKRQIEKASNVILDSRKYLYWATLYKGGKYQEIEGILAYPHKLPFCTSAH